MPAPITSTVNLSAEASSTLSNFVNQNTSKIIETETDIEIEEVTKEIVTKLYDGSNIRKFHGMDTIPIDDFISIILKDVPVIKIDQLNNKNETVSSYELEEKEPKTFGKKKKVKIKEKKKERKSLIYLRIKRILKKMGTKQILLAKAQKHKLTLQKIFL